MEGNNIISKHLQDKVKELSKVESIAKKYYGHLKAKCNGEPECNLNTVELIFYHEMQDYVGD